MSEKQLIGRLAEREREKSHAKRSEKGDSREKLIAVVLCGWHIPRGLLLLASQFKFEFGTHKAAAAETEIRTPRKKTRRRRPERERESLISYDILFSFPLGISCSILLHFTVMIQPTGMPAGSLHHSSYHYCHYIQKY